MNRLLCLAALLFSKWIIAQPLIQVGDAFPNYLLRPVVNAPTNNVDVWNIHGKFIILNMWGTWCAPCIPEMDSLTQLQRRYVNQIQVIGVSNDSEEKLRAYLKKRPTNLWLASDTASNLYRQAGFRFVGQSIILAPDKKVVALVKTDSINRFFIEKLIAGAPVASNAETGWEQKQEVGDPFGIDSGANSSVSLRSFLANKPSMSLTYLGTAMEGRRVTYFNVCPTSLYRDAYEISSPAQVEFEIPKDQQCNYSDKTSLVCFDLVVKLGQKDSLRILMQQALNRLLPFKARMEERKLPVYVLSRDSSNLSPILSTKSKQVYSYSGNGFSGEAIPIKIFAQYLANEAGRPVVDETGLKGKYDIETKLTLRTREEVLASLKQLGLKLKKEERMMPVLVIYK